MAEVLIFAGNNTHPDPEKDRRGCYKRGQPVVVFEDGHVWGREESKKVWIAEGRDPTLWPGQGRFIIIKLPGVPASRAQALINEQTEDDTGTETGRVYRRRRWRVLLDDLPAPVRTTLINDGEYVADTAAKRQAVRDRIKRIRDAVQYTGLD